MKATSAIIVVALSACTTVNDAQLQQQAHVQQLAARASFEAAYPNAQCRYEATKVTQLGMLHHHYKWMYNMDPFDEVYYQCNQLSRNK